MRDPVLNKLKADARIGFDDLWRALRTPTGLRDRRQAGKGPAKAQVEFAGPPRPPQDGRYFHLN